MQCLPHLWVAGVLCFSSGLLQASPIYYSESTTGSGSLGTSGFTDALVRLEYFGDTSGITIFGGIGLVNSGGMAQVTIEGLGTAVFTDSIVIVSVPSIGFGGVAVNKDSDLTAVLITSNEGFQSYLLDTGIGPLTGPTLGENTPVETALGTFTLDSTGDSTFEASTTPEPVSGTLIGLGLVGLLACRRRFRAA